MTSRQDGITKRTIRAEALNALAAAHPDEFRALMEDGYKAKGFTYTPTPTKEERDAARAAKQKDTARRQMAALLKRFPDLLDVDKDDAQLP